MSTNNIPSTQYQRIKLLSGMSWLKNGFWLYCQGHVLIIGLFMSSILALLLIGAIPLVGSVLIQFLLPFLLALYMLLCHELANKKTIANINLSNVAKKTAAHATSLITIGGISVAAQLMILGIVKMTGGGGIVELLLGNTVLSEQSVDAAVKGAEFSLTLGIVLLIVQSMSMLFSALLVVFSGVNPVKSLILSIKACFVNAMPLLAYYVLLVIPIFLASQALVAVHGLFFMLFTCLVLPVLVASIYAIYRDVFPMIEVATSDA